MIFEKKNFDFFEVKKIIFGGFLCSLTCFLKNWYVFDMCIKLEPKIWKNYLFLRDLEKNYPKSERKYVKIGIVFLTNCIKGPNFLGFFLKTTWSGISGK